MILKNARDLFIDRSIDIDKKDLELEKGDFSAIVIAAFVTLMPTLLLVFGIFAFFIILLFSR